MNPNDESREDRRFAALFASIDSEAAPPDEQFLDALRERSTEVFAAESRKRAPVSGRRHPVLVATYRIAAAAAAAAVLVAAWLWSSTSPSDSPLALGDVLENTARAETLHLEVTRGERTSKVWARAPHDLRWDEGGGRYKIARGEKLWMVDEEANRATFEPSPYFRADRPGIDLLDLLELPEARETLEGGRPVEQVRRDGVDFDVYRLEAPAQDAVLRIEALVETGSGRLRSLAAKTVRGGRVEPVVELTVVGFNEPLPEDLFVVGDTLTEDGRIGKVIDAQGIVSVKPVMRRRWTPVDRPLVLKPGDWLRTDIRGANAVRVRLVPETDVTLGPGSLIELIKPNRIRVFSGALKVAAGDKAPVKLLGPEQEEMTVKDTQVYRLQDERLVRLEQDPPWLQGFEGATAGESIGSLIANVEGRNVPLTVGYHHVTVDVRDQIARTVIEESFVNHTGDRLEGVFHFPLPQDASISGFGMWIGDKLIEADVVEKQRAREIYETILREDRDPGLLEWSGGNLFKARVFPILPHSEKRIKITYTQVLPLEGNRYRYSYPLQSEMLKQHPLRELSIDVKLNSVMPLASVTSPTHAARIRQRKHSAQVEFTAEEYTPTRDFEVVVELDGSQSEVVLVPHRRGDDGYFMLMVTPPAERADVLREVLPDGDPLELLLLADTSASIDADGRRAQAELIAAVLSSLTAEDKFNLAACDVECDWVFQKPSSAEAGNVEAARKLLEDRVSLGWTDLDKAFASALKQSGPRTHVIYVGDGVVTGTDPDPAAFCKRLQLLYQGKAATFHAVTVGSSFESMVMSTIASLGGGSVRRITGEHGPQAVALELLAGIARPAIRDLEVEFRGLRTARVYPDPLPNLPAGSQQILLGRYLPQGRDQVGEVVVTGTKDEKPVRFTTPVSLKDAEQGNSFIPRLWARMHLDSLLQQGASQAIQDEIIALSEEYNIITPYTSLLVLETDEDRERFQVKRRFRVRDAEKFFAEGRANVDYELLRQQMKRAGDWRIGLRREVLGQLGALGRDPQIFQAQRYAGVRGPRNYLYWAGGGGIGGGFDDALDVSRDSSSFRSFSWTLKERLARPVAGRAIDWEGAEKYQDADFQLGFETAGRSLSLETGGEDFFVAGDLWASEAPADGAWAFATGLQPLAKYASVDLATRGVYQARRRSRRIRGEPLGLVAASWPGEPPSRPEYTQWLNTLFPSLPPTPSKEKPAPPKRPWPADARAISQSLLRTEPLARIKGGLSIERRTESFEVRSGELTSRSRWLALVSPAAWLIRSEGDRSQTTVQWCNREQRGVLGRGFQLGRLRASEPLDLAKPPLGLSGHVLTPLHQTYRDYAVDLKPKGEQQTLLVLTNPDNPRREVHILVDTDRHVVLRIESRQDGELTSATAFDGFVEVLGCWWPGRIETTDKKGRRTTLATQQFQPLEAEAFDQQVEGELAGREQVQFLREPLTEVVDAKRALAAGKATFDDQLALLLHFCGSQQWERVMEHLDGAEKLADGKPGMRWVRSAVLDVSRRREELKQWILEDAARLAQPPEGGQSRSEELFLAEYLVGQGSAFLPPIEMLPLLDALKPVYQRQDEHLHVMKGWSRRRADFLDRSAKRDEALAIRRHLAEAYPHDYGVQQQYAQALINVQEYAAAKAWLDRVLQQDFEWYDHEEEQMRRVYVDSLRSRGRYAELVDYFAPWIERNPQDESVYRRYLDALIHADREDEANALMTRWLKEARQPGRLAPDVAARLEAAVSQALGQGYYRYRDEIEERWLGPLAETALFFARHEFRISVADRIMGHYRFQDSDECRGIRKSVAGMLRTEIDTLRVEQIEQFVDWIMRNDPAVEAGVWKRIAAGLQRRWSAEAKPEIKNRLGRVLATVLSERAAAAEHLAFLRLQLQKGPQQYRAGYAGALFDALLGQPWSAELEGEAVGLLEQLSDAEKPAERLFRQVAALCRLTDTMVKARFDARMKAVEHQERLTRTELREKQIENLRRAREGFAKRLRQEVPKRSKPLADWINIERLYLETILARNLDAIAAECWELLGPQPPKPTEVEPGQETERLLEDLLLQRFLITAMNLAARRSAEPALVDRLLKYLDDGIALEGEGIGWKLLKYQVLVALDRPDDLEKSLRAWIRSDDPGSEWRRSLGYLLAEQGKIDEAIKLFEAVEAADELGPADYRTLAGWYMFVGRRPLHRRALVAMFKTMEEWRLSQWLSGQLEPWRREGYLDRRSGLRPGSQGRVPAELDADVIWAFTAIFEKSGRPQNYLGELQQFYQATHDFRLLACLADAVVGHSAAKVYPFLEGMQGPNHILFEIRDEATADSLLEHLAEVRKRAKTPIDQRALDLLEALVERRAAELLNQPGPHADAAVAAFERAFKREWTEGEPRLMADLLAALGAISHPKLADERIRQLQILHDRQALGSLDRLHIAHCLARALWASSRRDEAVDSLEAALGEFSGAVGPVLPTDANGPISTFISYLENQGHHARAEQVLVEQLEHPVHRQQALWLTERLYELYEHAVRHDGNLSLGTGQTLYQAVQGEIRDAMDTDDNNHRRALIERLSGIYRGAHEKQLAGVVDDLRSFAFQRLPEVLKQQTNDYESCVATVAETMHDLAGARDGLAFLTQRIPDEPAWLRYERRDGWNQHANRLARWRIEVKDLGDLEEGLLAIVTAELRRDLLSRRQHNRIIYSPHPKYFWKEKADAFAATAEEVLAQRKHSGASLQYVADYLYTCLSRHDRAIEILFAAHSQGILDEGGQWKLVEFLHGRQRFGESIGLLEPLVQRRPDTMKYRVWLMRAYFGTGRTEELLALLEKTDAYFHQEDRWQESDIYELAHYGCLETGLFEQAVAYYEELIPLHQRTTPRRPEGDDTLSRYYGDLATANANLGKTAEGVDAAGAGIVSWGTNYSRRKEALRILNLVLRQARNLDAYVTQLDEEVAQSGLEKPIVRKAIGQVYLETGKLDQAIAQLKIAARLQPNDAETLEALVQCYDRQQDKEGAVREVLAWLELSRREIERYRDLGRRLQALEKPDEAERAYTSIVEVLPNESESHTLLAEIRQEQDRWPEAIAHWEQVARIRALEPTGLVKLAAAQVHQEQWDEAARTLKKLRAQSWPPRFDQVENEIRDLERQIERGRNR